MIHFFSSCGIVLAVSFALALLQRKKPQPWLPSTLQQIVVTAAILVFAMSTLREAYDVSKGGLLVKSTFDYISWAGGSAVSAWGLLRLRKWAREESS